MASNDPQMDPTVLRITIDVFPAELFDMLSRMKGDTTGLGTRIAQLCLTGEIDHLIAIGLSIYGIVHIKTERINEKSNSDSHGRV